ncbi:MAG: CBS domain-containing protein [Bacteroidia bacterium]|nr:CBS domain-containing protein [Bacteroidia bacterium]
MIGVCHLRDLLISLAKDQKKKKVSDFIKKEIPIFVPENIKLDKLLPFFQKEKIHMAVVQDDFGGTSGVVTLEDVLEQIVGEIMDETDKDIDLRKKAKEINENLL